VNLILFEPSELGTPLPKRDDRTVHLVKTLHKKVGDTFDAGLWGGLMGVGKIESLRSDGSLAFSLNLTIPPLPRLPIRIGVGFPRPIQLRRLLRDLSSLGVSAIDLILTDLGDRAYRDTTLLTDGGAQASLREGAIQSRDTTVPILSTYPSLSAWLEKAPWGTAGPTFPGYTKMEPGAAVGPGALDSIGQSPGNWTLLAPDNVRPQGSMGDLGPLVGPLVIAIGSERGWSDRERSLLESHGFMRPSLGPRALRTETACVAAVILGMEKIGALR